MLKKLLLFVAGLTLCVSLFAENIGVAILPAIDRDNEVDRAYKFSIRQYIVTGITTVHGYEAYDRINLGTVLDEQKFQRDGMVKAADIKKIGEMTGAQYVLIIEVMLFPKNPDVILVSAQFEDVETARIIQSATSNVHVTDEELLEQECISLAQKLLGVSRNTRPSASVSTSTPTPTPKTSQQVVTVKTAPSGTSSSRQFDIGDEYSFPDGTRGIVFFKSDDGHGLVVSLDEGNNLKWDNNRRTTDIMDIENESEENIQTELYQFKTSWGRGYEQTNSILNELSENGAAANWCRSLGEGWYCPSAAELLYLFKVANKRGEIDEVLNSCGVKGFSGWYWSSSEYNRGEAWNLNNRGRLCSENKDEKISVRAVRAF